MHGFTSIAVAKLSLNLLVSAYEPCGTSKLSANGIALSWSLLAYVQYAARSAFLAETDLSVHDGSWCDGRVGCREGFDKHPSYKTYRKYTS